MKSHPSFFVTILGNGSAVPTATTNLTSQIVTFGKLRFMIDCGEGTQHQLFRLHIRQANLDHVLISHLHGDHFYGLFGLLSTMHLFGREKPFTVFAPAALESVIAQVLQISDTTLRFPLVFQALENYANTPLIHNKDITINCFPVLHRIPTWGFTFTEQPKPRKISKEFLNTHQPNIEDIKAIKAGAGYTTSSGEFLSHEEVTEIPQKTRSYAFCADTAYHEPIIEYIQQFDLIYHEATFDDSMEKLAKEKFHATARHAAELAKKAQVGQLLLGHFSARHKELTNLLAQAQEVFPDTVLSEEGKTYNVG